MYNVVLVDDDKYVLQQMSMLPIWEELELNIVGICGDVDVALKCIDENDVDIVITDIKMSGRDGIELIRLCNERYKNLKCIIISAYRDFDYAKNSIQYNAWRYLTKPIDVDELYETLLSLIQYLKTEETRKMHSTKLKLEISDAMYSSVSGDEEFCCDQNLLNEICEGFEPTCYLITLVLNNYDEYVQKTAKYGRFRQSLIIYQIVHSEEKTYMVVMLQHLANHIRCIMFNRSNVKNKYFAAKECIEKIKRNLKELIFLDAEAIAVEKFDSLNQCLQYAVQNRLVALEERERIIDTALNYINENYMGNISLVDVAHHVAMNPTYFSRFFKKSTGDGFIVYLTRIRLKRACEMLTDTNMAIKAICDAVGYKNMTHFYRQFKDEYGVTPNEYRNINKGKKNNDRG